jgi:hypothetical protein
MSGSIFASVGAFKLACSGLSGDSQSANMPVAAENNAPVHLRDDVPLAIVVADFVNRYSGRK